MIGSQQEGVGWLLLSCARRRGALDSNGLGCQVFYRLTLFLYVTF